MVATGDGDSRQATATDIEGAPAAATSEVSVATPVAPVLEAAAAAAAAAAETATTDTAPGEPVALVAGDAKPIVEPKPEPEPESDPVLDGPCKACPPFRRHVRHTCPPAGLSSSLPSHCLSLL